jgi:hypothetical protein
MTPENNRLVALLAKGVADQCPSLPREGNVNYYERFRTNERFLATNVHHLTTAAAMAQQIKHIEKLAKNSNVTRRILLDEIVKNSIWLTDHGVTHVETVIERAAQLVLKGNCNLTAYEAFILLMACHFHDVGNVYGREKHEQRISAIMDSIDPAVIGDNTFERRLVADIAAAHGGKIGNDKDTIGALPYKAQPGPDEVRAHLLAAILRFADELAEDYTRASRFAIDHDLILKASEVYHQYADRLRKVKINEGAIELSFELNKAVSMQKYGKGAKQVFLLDEIFDRTLKLHLEHLYCMRFMRPYIHFSRITIRIDVYNSNYSKPLRPAVHIQYDLEESGYPASPRAGIHYVCANLVNGSGANWTGQLLQDTVTEVESD